MNDVTRATLESPAFATRRRANRAAAVFASSGLIVGMGAVGATPALAATAADCDDANTLSSPADDAGDIQDLLDLNTPIICLSGTFAVATPLVFDHDLTLYGLTAAELDGDNLSAILRGSDNADLTVQNIAFVDGVAADGSVVNGGAIYVNGSLVVENSTFTSNSSSEDGGAIYVGDSPDDQTISIIDSTFTGNSTGTGFGGYSGGAVFADSFVETTIQGSTFTENTASAAGGAVYGLFVLAENSTFTDNTATFGGGGLYAAVAGSFESTFSDNEAEGGGGMLVFGYGLAAGSTFVNNQADEAGGAVASYGSLLVINSTFDSNDSGWIGGAIFAEAGEIGLSTFVDNTAVSDEPGNQSDSVYMLGGDTSTVVGNIFAGSGSNAHLGSGAINAYNDLGGNIFSTAASTESALGTSGEGTLFSQSKTAIFGTSTLADNGGSTETLALVAGSPAIDAVPASAFDAVSAPSSLESAAADFVASAAFQAAVDSVDVDQRNVARTGLADAGAYEYGDAELAATGGDAETSGWLAALAALLLGAGATIALGSRRLSRDDR